MLSYSRAHLADHVVLRELAAATAHDRAGTAELLALIAEAHRRGLHRSQGYPSLSTYLIDKLGMPEDMVYKRIGAARVAMQYPGIFAMVADGRLHLTAILMLRPHLTPENAEGLFAAAAGKSRDQISLLLARRFPRADTPTSLVPVSPATVAGATSVQSDVPTSAAAAVQPVANAESALAPERVAPENSVPITVQGVPPAAQRRVAPLSPDRFELRLTISQVVYDKIKRAQELLGHSLPTGDIPQLLERALDELIAKQERLQFAAADKPRKARASRNPRHIPAAVKRAVFKRDRGQCTYVSDDGHRCESRKFLQYDHVLPVARGGASTVDNVRLRCGPHNQLEAERVYGAGFMEEKKRREDTGILGASDRTKLALH
jgi:5-methylcytosine-specific restriction endonuclease McrA